MKITDRRSPTDMEEMPENSETSRLVTPNATSKTSYINLVGNVCALLFVCIIIYCCFFNEVTLFSFHPTLMALGVSLCDLAYYDYTYNFSLINLFSRKFNYVDDR